VCNNKIICPNCGEDNIVDNDKCETCKANLLLNDKYYLIKVLGGNIGITYLANIVGDNSNSPILIKELSIKSVDRWKTEELFKREGNILKSLNNVSIPKFIEQFVININKNISYFLVMEFIEGKTLKEELKEKIYNENEVFALIKEITIILDYLHNFRPPIIHRDIKPSNIIRKKDGKLSLIDFGGVKDAINSNIGSTVAGTFGYASPEQILGKSVTQSDFYSLGMLALVLLTKKDISELIENIDLNLEQYNFLSNKMLSLIDKLIADKVSDRFKNTSEILYFFDIDGQEFVNKNSFNKVSAKDTRNDVEILLSDYKKLVNEFNFLKKYYLKSIVFMFLMMSGGVLLFIDSSFSNIDIFIIITVVLAVLSVVYIELILRKFLKNSKKITNDNILVYIVAKYGLQKITGTVADNDLDSNFKRYITNPKKLDKGEIKLYEKIINQNAVK